MNFTPGEQSTFALRPGDVLVTEGSGSLSTVGASAAWQGEIPGTICFQNTLLRLRPRDGQTNQRFLAWWSQATFADGTYASIASGANIFHVSAERVRALPLRCPPLGEQLRIADFLDAETTHIDKINILRSRQKNELEQRRWAEFQDILGRTSTIDLPLRRLLHSVTDGPFGSAFSSSDYVDDGAAVVRLGNIGFCEYRPQDQARIPNELFKRFRRHEVRVGDIIIAGLGDPRNHAGRACIAPDLGPAIVKGKCFRARVDPTKTSAEFLTMLLSSPIGADVLEGRGSTRSMINLEIVKSAVFPIPRFEDQVAIAKEIVRHWQSALAAIQACDRQAALLAERRQALITAAVTGAITV